MKQYWILKQGIIIDTTKCKIIKNKTGTLGVSYCAIPKGVKHSTDMNIEFLEKHIIARTNILFYLPTQEQNMLNTLIISHGGSINKKYEIHKGIDCMGNFAVSIYSVGGWKYVTTPYFSCEKNQDLFKYLNISEHYYYQNGFVFEM